MSVETDKAFPNDPPDLRTLEGQLFLLNYHAPDEKAVLRHAVINEAIQVLWQTVAQHLSEGPGKTRALHAVNRARMEMNANIATFGA